MSNGLRSHGGFRHLRSFQVAEIIYDGTVTFCERLVDKRSRTHDQMVQAARSGRQNIAEGSRASATSSQTELRLVNVARASLDELLLDFEDYLRQRDLPQWGKDDPAARQVRAVGSTNHPAADAYAPWLAHPEPAVGANALICLIHQANYLLDRQVAALERQFIEEGGSSERLHVARLQERERQRQRNQTDRTDRLCPACGRPMILRTARQGPYAGGQFWGCSGFPDCRAIQPAS
ncbi:four helix bundle suffix domain-containing protein [Geomesophilobacter sediminis]|uniref:Four helix bundle protein n=1 Tax=Geomesophilobacter sediminis TaxID=2798584 RepID=A0A8J7J603_9BACT|nr:four helix bundle suffix domain-containing protein [Geomesophilobacter sediminis]MBJ6724016.1 four helix bundle protein [Geomesophilobacter sediminis]